MRICLVGNFTDNPDEGMNNISQTIKNLLSENNDILALNPRDILKIKKNNIRSFNPKIVHYLHGPTLRSLIILKLFKILSGKNTKTIVSATRPYFPSYFHWLLNLLKPNRILTQSIKYENLFNEKGMNVAFLPNGVDCNRFCPVPDNNKNQIKKELNIRTNQHIILHVGHIKTNRGLELFKNIQKQDNIQVVIVGGISQKADDKLKSELEETGIKVFHKFYADISIFYKMADLYIFPVKDIGNSFPRKYDQIGAIDTPLSVLEAMACNLPVITTPFGALQRIFNSDEGFLFCDSQEDILNNIDNILKIKPKTNRDKVLKYDWPLIIKQLENIYQDILESSL